MAKRERPDPRVQRKTQCLSSGDPTKVAEIEREIQSMPPDQAVPLLLSVLESNRRTRRAIPYGILTAIVVGCVVSWVFSLIGHPLPPGSVIPGMLSGLTMSWFASNRLRANSASLLVHFEDPRLIDALVTNLKSGTTSLSAPQKALTRLLPTLSPAQSQLVSRESRAFLNSSLLSSGSREFVFAILAAWEQIGDHTSLPFVEKLSRGEAVLGRDQTIRHTAMEALPAIHESANRVTVSQTLLRAAEPGETTPLLRPAPSGDTKEEVLLRPAAEK